MAFDLFYIDVDMLRQMANVEDLTFEPIKVFFMFICLIISELAQYESNKTIMLKYLLIDHIIK